jgi:nitrogen fixation/metabolism regulation signal transduction histidine kinase
MTTNEESSLPAHPTSQTGVDTSPGAWSTLIEAIEDGVCVQSLDSRIVCANSAFADIIGAPLGQIVYVNEAIHRAVTLARYQAAKAGSTQGRQIKIEFVADSVPVVMKIDAAQIEDAVHGILTNAIEAIDGDGAVFVRLSECDSNNRAGRV